MVRIVGRENGYEAVSSYGRPILVLNARGITEEYAIVQERFPGAKVLHQELRIDRDGCPYDVLTVAPAYPGAARVRVWFAIGDFFKLPGQPSQCGDRAPSLGSPLAGAETQAKSYSAKEAEDLLRDTAARVATLNMDVLAQVHGGDRPARAFDGAAWDRFLNTELPTSVLVPGVAPQYGPDGPMGWRQYVRDNLESPTALTIFSDRIARETNEFLSALRMFHDRFVAAGGTPSGERPRQPRIDELPLPIAETEELPGEIAKTVVLGPLATKQAQKILEEHAQDLAKAAAIDTAQLRRYALIAGGVTLGAVALGLVLALRRI